MLAQLLLACATARVATGSVDYSAAPADPAAVVITPDGKARFTVLTPRLIRAEFSATGTFDDRQTLTVVNRRLPVPKFHTTNADDGDTFHLTTDSLVVGYNPNPAPSPPPPRPVDFCNGTIGRTVSCGLSRFAVDCSHNRSPSAPSGLDGLTEAECCAACSTRADCEVWMSSNAEPTGHCDLYAEVTSTVGHYGADTIVGGRFGSPPARGFKPGALTIATATDAAPPLFGWAVGDMDHGNLGGTITGLDSTTGAVSLNCSGPQPGDRRPNPGMKVGCDFGPISRNGWAVIDDSARDRLDPRAQWLAPPTNRTSDHYTDLYFFGYGHAYTAALQAYASIAGAAKAPPRFALGVWWSRYWPYTAEDLEDIARGYAEHSVPLDVLVSDMAWHYHGEQPVAWGGYTFGSQLFPEPDHFVKTVTAAGLNLTLNLHLEPVDPKNENPEHFAPFAAALGFPSTHTSPIPGPGSPPFTGSVAEEIASSKTFATAYLALLDRMGTKFWWLDDTPDWVARVLYEHSATRMDNGLAFARWGGLGSHRYPIGFSGDTYIEWETLRFQPYFTATASNVLFAWSHDIGGHRSTECPSTTEPDEPCEFNHTDAAYDPELYLRWLQWGAHSPILRTHPQPDPKVERRAWGYPLPVAEYMRAAFARRARLVPALFTANHALETTAVAAVRPVYYGYPDQPGAYAYPDTYAFCDGLLVAPITSPQSNASLLATRELWLPPGGWVDTASGVETVSPTPEGMVVNVSATLWEMPVFARSGTMIPVSPSPGVPLGSLNPALAQPPLGSAAREPAVLSWEVWSGSAPTGAGTVWEESRGGTNATYNLDPAGTTLELRTTAERPGAPARRHRFELQNLPPPTSVMACSAATRIEGPAMYDGRVLAVNIDATVAGGSDAGAGAGCITVVFGASLRSANITALRAVPYRTLRQRLHVIKKQVDDLSRPGPFLMPMVEAINTAARIAAAADLDTRAVAPMATWAAELAAFEGRVRDALVAIEKWGETGHGSAAIAMDQLTITSRAWLSPGAATPVASSASRHR